jgi:hypothetical protein
MSVGAKPTLLRLASNAGGDIRRLGYRANMRDGHSALRRYAPERLKFWGKLDDR